MGGVDYFDVAGAGGIGRSGLADLETVLPSEKNSFEMQPMPRWEMKRRQAMDELRPGTVLIGWTADSKSNLIDITSGWKKRKKTRGRRKKRLGVVQVV